MSAKRKIRMATDLVIITLLPVLMAYSLVGEAVHEWLGIVMSLLFIIHHIFNRHWYKNLIKGPYPPLRMLSAGINLLLVVVMITLPVSGIMMAKHTFHFIRFPSGAASARLIHLLASYWGFVLMCLHLGLHWNIVLGKIKRAMGITKKSLWRAWLLRMPGVAGSIYGGYVFFKRGFAEYMFLKTQFVFYDYDKPLSLFFMDYLAVMALFVFIGHYVTKGIGKERQGNIMDDKELLTKCYHAMYHGMIRKDMELLEDSLDESFVLVHMTGMRQTKRQYMDYIANGTLNYYSEETEHMEITVDENQAQLIGKSRVNAAVFGGDKHVWRLQLSMKAVKRNGKWYMTEASASTY